MLRCVKRIYCRSGLSTASSFWTVVVAFAVLNCLLLFNAGMYSLGKNSKERLQKRDVHTPSRITQPTQTKIINASTVTLNGFELAAHARRKCQDMSTSMNVTQWLLDVYVISSKNAIICPVEKIASTFWRRVVFLAENPSSKSKHPYQIPINAALSQKFKVLKSGNDSREQGHFKFVFVRNPYYRVLSAYIDKVFSPNPMFWGRIGLPSISKFRKEGGNSQRKKCYHDATFLEFIQFVIWSEREDKRMADNHFLQASEKCRPCFTNYTFIGKMESFQEDASYIFDRFGLDGAQQSLQGNMKELSNRDAIEDSVTSPFYWKRAIEQCMPWIEALQRVWRKLQMRGLIDIDIPFPLLKAKTVGANKMEFLKLALKAWQDSDPTKLKRQKHMVLAEMYGELPSEVLQGFQQTYSEDFLLFNYPDRPDWLAEKYEKRNLTVL